MKQSSDSMKKQELMNDPQEQRQSFTGSIPSSDKTKVDEKGMAQQIHPSYGDCYRYFRTGRCGRRHFEFNHHTKLPQELQDRAHTPVCKYFLSGHCKKGSRCDLRHVMNSDDGAEHMPQSTSQKATESVQGFEASGSKRPRSPMNPSVNAQENLHEQRQENIKRQRRETQVHVQQQRLMMMESHNVEAQNQQNMEEQRQREMERMRLRRLRAAQELSEKTNVPVCNVKRDDGAEPMPQKSPENRFMAVQRARERREAQGNMQEQGSIGRLRNLSDLIDPIAEAILRERMELPVKTNVLVCKYFLRGYCKKGSRCDFYHAMDKGGSEPMPQSTSQRGSGSRQGFEESGFRRPRTPVNHRFNAQLNMQQQRLMREMPENQNVVAQNQLNPEEQRKIEIERMRTESRLKLDQMEPTVQFDEWRRASEGMKEFGFKDAKGL